MCQVYLYSCYVPFTYTYKNEQHSTSVQAHKADFLCVTTTRKHDAYRFRPFQTWTAIHINTH